MITNPPTLAQPDELASALQQLFALQVFEVKLGLDRTIDLLEHIGNPHRSLRFVHVAGTNGKGSVCAMIASVLQASGLRVGLFCSPHLLRFNERIRINGRAMDDESLVRYLRDLLPLVMKTGSTFFEGTTALAFKYFADEGVDVVVLETGMGGRLDSTNVVQPIVSVITAIGFDHTKQLGNSLRKIAAEKAGIIKNGAGVVVGPVPMRIRSVFDTKGHDVGSHSPLFVDDVSHANVESITSDGMIVSFRVRGNDLSDVALDLIGKHQVVNARTALVTIDTLRSEFNITDDALRLGMASVQASTGLRARFETVIRKPYVVLDVAHNPDGARSLVHTLRQISASPENTRIVFGCVSDKDVKSVLTILREYASTLYAVRADSQRALNAEDIADLATQLGIASQSFDTVAAGIDKAMADATDDSTVIICGSFFVVGEAMQHLGIHDTDHAAPSSALHNGLNDYTVNNSLAESRTSVRDWKSGEQPRQRLLNNGALSLSDAELLAILLRSGTKKHDVVQMCRELINTYGSVSSMAKRSVAELKTMHGIGTTKAITLLAAFELTKRMETPPFDSTVQITGPEDIARMFIPRLRNATKEEFHIVMLTSAKRVIGTRRISEGSLNSSIVHPREVFQHAITECAASIIGVHNHPSGNPTPSQEDIVITRQLADAGRLLGIPLNDHIIVGGDSFVSMAGDGVF